LRSLAAGQGLDWKEAVALASARIDFVLTNAPAETVRRLAASPPVGLSTKPVRLAILASSTMTHLLPATRVAGLRRGLWIETYENDFGQHMRELEDESSGLRAFGPTAILLALDAHDLSAGMIAAMDAEAAESALGVKVEHVRAIWRRIRATFHCPVLHQMAPPVLPPLLGDNEHRLAGSPAAFLVRLNERLRLAADEEGVDILALDTRVARDGLAAWHKPNLWHRAKQEVVLSAAPMYGDLVGRWIAAKQGRSFRCLVLDLDNTLWGGVIGEDGLGGIELGQGSALGESFVAFQRYARELGRRGVILAVCSKNDEADALEPFDRHPDMVLRRADISCFVANWSDKAANLRAIADHLKIGLDSLVFVDDSPFERELIRREMPMVAVPEMPDDPADWPALLADAGYFEALAITDEDRARVRLYETDRAREAQMTSATDLSSYLRGLDMRLAWKRFDPIGAKRVSQLINKSNQFNLTTRRYTDEDVMALMRDGNALCLQLRLIDRFGDNGMIGVIIGRMMVDGAMLIDTWLMSCRVLGRGVEAAALNLLVAEAGKMGARRLIGEYIPTPRNNMVRDHYVKLGFAAAERAPDGRARFTLDLAAFEPFDTFIQLTGG
jgi:FkbH-like protein